MNFMILRLIRSYVILIFRWLFVLGISYLLYLFFVCRHGFTIVQFVTLLGIVLAFFKDLILDLLLPPIFKITTSNSKPHFHKFPTDDKHIHEFWLAIEVKNIGLSSARNVLVYFNGIESNRVSDFDAFLSLPIRKAFGEVPKDKDPLPRPVLIPRNTRFFFSFCHIRDHEPQVIHFSFPRNPVALEQIDCGNGEESFFEFQIQVVTDARFAINTKSKFKFFYDGVSVNGFKFV